MSGGATKSFLAMMEEAKNAGIECQVICPESGGVAKYLRESGVEVSVCDYRRAALPPINCFLDVLKWMPRLIHDSVVNRRAVSRLLRQIDGFKPDLIHENSSAVNIGYRLAKALHIPYVLHVREYGWKDFKLYMPDLKKRIADKSTYVITITKDLFRHRNLYGNSHAIQLYNGIISKNSIRYTEEKSDYFLYAGRIDPGKGILDLIEAYIDYSVKVDSPLHLLVAGGCSYPAFEYSLRQKIIDHGLDEHVKWLGNREDVGDLMYKAVATIVPSYHEGLGRVFPEAMANGCLCVGRYTGGTKEQIDIGLELTGGDVAIPFNTREELSDVLCEITENVKSGDRFKIGGEYYDLIMRAHNSVVEFFTVEKFGERLFEFYQKISRHVL